MLADCLTFMGLERRATIKLVSGIGGVDEAGRGPLAGPVVAAVVVLEPGQTISGVRDSKQLSASRRESLAAAIREQAVACALGQAEVAEIDKLNILHATMLAMRRAIAALNVVPERLQFDGNRAPDLPGYPGVAETIVGGDRTREPISAASILAKVHRDRIMLGLDRQFPAYGFARHKGYPTAAHRDALLRLGPCPAHRVSFRPVRLVIQALGGAA
jgi:ribonuclease HII